MRLTSSEESAEGPPLVEPNGNSAGFGFESRGAHETPGQRLFFLKVSAEMALGEPKGSHAAQNSSRIAQATRGFRFNVMLFDGSS